MFSWWEKKKINTQAKRDLARKLKLERTFEPEIRSLFAQMNRDFQISVAANGQAPSAGDYSPAWEAALKKHYIRVQNEFLGVVDIKRDNGHEHKLFEELLALALLNYRKARAIAQSFFIRRTNAKEMTQSISKARQSLSEQGLPTDNKTISKTASTILKRKTNNRVDAIKILETQSPAEATKIMEARTQAGIRPTDTRTSGVSKTFRTIGDKKVRVKPFSHKAANFQEVPINEPFEVGGQLMMFPTDTSLGATQPNIQK